MDGGATLVFRTKVVTEWAGMAATNCSAATVGGMIVAVLSLGVVCVSAAICQFRDPKSPRLYVTLRVLLLVLIITNTRFEFVGFQAASVLVSFTEIILQPGRMNSLNWPM